MDIDPPAYFQRNLLPNLTLFIKVYLKKDRLHYDQITISEGGYNFACDLYLDTLPEDVIPSTDVIWKDKLSQFLDFLVTYCEEETK